MARYTTQTWTDGSGGGTPISGARLGVIETGIFAVDYRPAARVTHNAAQSIANNTVTALAFNTERFDQASNAASTIHDTVTNNSRLTCRVAGVYRISGNIEWPAASGGQRDVIIRHQGVTIIGRLNDLGSASLVQVQNVSVIYSLAVNEYVELCAFQTSGGALNVNASGNYSPEFMMELIG